VGLQRRLVPWTLPKEERYAAGIANGLRKAFKRAEEREQPLELSQARIIVFSDQHKGTRDGADDFRRCERAYNAALAWYHENGYHLIALGDVEEMWENDPDEVLEAYPCTLGLEQLFHEAKPSRYTRVYGNHDHQWSQPEPVEKLQAIFPGLEVLESIRLRIRDGGQDLGVLFLAHGHQGTPESDRLSFLSRPAVRHLWKPLQKKLNKPWNTPAVDWALREDHDKAMFAWAKGHRERPVLIAGHTHRPVFGEQVVSEKTESPAQIKKELDAQRSPELWAKLEWAKAAQRRLERQRITVSPPCYFNTGCCSFGDGDITGIEIANKQITLVRWASDGKIWEPEVLGQPRELREVLQAVRQGTGAEAHEPDAPRGASDCSPSGAPPPA